MELNTLYNIADKEKICVTEKNLEHAKGMYVTCNNIDVILINKHAINSNKEELCVLAEELGHYYCNAYYNINCTNKTLIDKNEYRAIKWAFKALINKRDIVSLLKEEKSKYEVCEELGVTEELLEKAYNYYTSN